MKLTYMLDCSRNAVITVSAVARLVKELKRWGYEGLSLYCEDTYEVPEEPYFGAFRGRYSREELKKIDEICCAAGLRFSLSVQTLAHMRGIYRHEPYYSEVIDCNDVLFAGEERTYRLIENMFAALSEALSSKEVNIGMDEPRMLGRGKYLDKHGYVPPETLFMRHLEKVLSLAEKYRLKVSMWGDFLFGHRNEAIDRLIERYGVRVIYWDYGGTGDGERARYVKNLQEGKTRFSKLAFAGSDGKFYGLAPHNRFAVSAAKPFFLSCAECGIDDVILTSWGDTGAEVSTFATLPVIAYYGCCANGDNPLFFEKKFSSFYGDLEAFYLLDSANELGEERGKSLNTSSKYLLYQDVFLGWMDKSVREFSALYEGHLKRLAEARGRVGAEFRYLFDTQSALIAALKEKYDLGVRLRGAYRRGDKAELLSLAEKRIPAAGKAVCRYAEKFSEQWLTDNKPFGLEVHEARLGALRYRLERCGKRLLDYLAGKTEKIEELEEDVPDAFGNGDGIVILNWGELISAGVVAEYNSFV